MSEIDKLRNQMDDTTLEIIRLLKKRVGISKEIGSIKSNLGIGITDEERESQLRTKVLALCEEIGLDRSIAAKFLNFLLNESVKIQSSNKQTHLSVFLKSKELERQGKKIIHMEVGEPDFPPPSIVKNALEEVYEKGFGRYGEARGMPQFREALAKNISDKYETSAKDENIIVCTGARFAVYLAISTLLDPGDELVVIEPSWPAYQDCAMITGIKTRIVHTTLENKWEPQLDEIADKINPNTKMIVLNYPNNPTGRIIPEKIQDEIIQLAIKNNLYILSDEIYSEYCFSDWKSVLSYDYKKAIVTKSFSKSHSMTGFRIGYAVSSSEIINKMSKLQATCMTNVSEPIQYVAMKALNANVTHNKSEIKNKLDIVIKKAKEIGLQFIEPDGAMYIFATGGRDNFDGTNFTNRLLDKGVAIAPGESFGNYKNFIRISACQSEKNLIEGMQIIESTLKEK